MAGARGAGPVQLQRLQRVPALPSVMQSGGVLSGVVPACLGRRVRVPTWK